MTRTVSMTEHPLWNLAGKKRTLLHLTLELTKRCNNNCVHCYNNLPESDARALARELSTGQVKHLIDQAVDLGLLWVLLTGGEILLRDDFVDLFMYMKKKGLLVSLFTNATLITRDHARLFRKYPPRGIEVSVYGVSEKGYARVARTDNFSRFMTGIENLQSENVPFALKTTVMKANVRQLDEIAEFCIRYADKAHRKFRFDPFLMLRTDKNPSRNRDIINQRLSVEQIVDIEKSNADRFEAMKTQCARILEGAALPDGSDKIFKCSAGLNSCFIDSSGSFRLCSSLVNENCVYDLTNGSLKDALENLVPRVHALTSAHVPYLENCALCRLRDFCMWCPARCDLETGRLDAFVPSFCRITHDRYETCIDSFSKEQKNHYGQEENKQ